MEVIGQHRYRKSHIHTYQRFTKLRFEKKSQTVTSKIYDWPLLVCIWRWWFFPRLPATGRECSQSARIWMPFNYTRRWFSSLGGRRLHHFLTPHLVWWISSCIIYRMTGWLFPARGPTLGQQTRSSGSRGPIIGFLRGPLMEHHAVICHRFRGLV